MTFSTATFDRDAAVVRAFDGRDVAELSPEDFVALRTAVGQAKRSFDALVACVAGEAARRSDPNLGVDGLARREGHRRPESMVAEDLGVGPGEAGRLIRIGETLRRAEDAEQGRPALHAEDVVPHPHIAAALREGLIGIEAARTVTECLDTLDPSTPEAGDLDALERQLVAKAQKLSLRDLRRACQRQVAFRSPRDLAARDRRLRRDRFLSFSDDPSGMVIMHGRLDPISAAPIRAWVDAQVRDALQRKRDEPGGDDRDAGQMRLDALVMLAQHGLDCSAPTSGVKTTVVLRADVKDLEAGVGVAECDQLAGRIAVQTLRAMAVDAGVIPVVMGGASLPLGVGRTHRLFTAAQRLALAERDGGCSWCHAPPSYCEAHHIEWWSKGGASDLANGVLLCTACHHRIHNDGWAVEVIGNEVWFTPPASMDPSRTPRVGGKAQLDEIETNPDDLGRTLPAASPAGPRGEDMPGGSRDASSESAALASAEDPMATATESPTTLEADRARATLFGIARPARSAGRAPRARRRRTDASCADGRSTTRARAAVPA
ncbi:HNH endonuclease signature motif containing protein [Demequina sp. NBRC 110053]|uniref:HNH endonuclease n=1 Tax=Demequina sp. NBRC 110053 TaxID=1570342 RepID=UPI000A032394|nr:HNH endonuclease signature motif containing protein [Demequina sp. NBRC 110053]